MESLKNSYKEVVQTSRDDTYKLPSVLSIAGSDSSGGAGIQADIKTIEALGLFAQTAITAVTAQNTCGVTDIVNITPSCVTAQIDAVFGDICPTAVKIGMVSAPEIIQAIAEDLRRHNAQNIVVDPVMVSTSGSRLISEEALDTLVSELFAVADIITPNVPEAEILTGMEIATDQDMIAAAKKLAGMVDHAAVMLKAGHALNHANDLLYVNDEVTWLEGVRIDTDNTHGTGCTLSSAIACGLATGLSVQEAAREAKDYVAGALQAGLNMGKGSGPLDHMWFHRL